MSFLDINSKMTIENFSTRNSDSQTLLRITISINLSVTEHISNLCKKANMKIAALARTFPCMTLRQKNNLIKA